MRNVARPFLILTLILLTVAIGSKILVNNISDLGANLATSKKTEEILQKKFTSLQIIDPQVTAGSQVSISALPPTNPALSVISNVRRQAQTFGLLINNFNSGGVASSLNKKFLSGEVVVQIDGPYKDLVSVINGVKNLAPIISFSSIKMVNRSIQDVSAYRMTLHLLTYWAALPATVPSIGKPFEGLTSEEEKILTQISSLQPPSTSTVGSTPSAEFSSGRTDPFAF